MGCKCTKPEEEQGEDYTKIKENQIENRTNSQFDQKTNENEENTSMLNYEISFLKSNKKVKDNEEYQKEVLKLFNLSRNKPLIYCKYIDYCITLISSNNDGHIVLGKDNTNKISLKEGISKFNECKRCLLQSEPCEELVFDKDLIIEIPEDQSLWLNHDNIKELITNKQNQILGDNRKNYSLFGFHFDYGMIDPVISSVLQLVDDNNCENRRRMNIVNQEYSAVGISYKMKGRKFIAYFFFAG